MELASGGGAPARARSEGGPLATDEFAVPAKERLRAGEQGLPGLAGEEPAESGGEAIGRTPAWTLNLALKDAELVAGTRTSAWSRSSD